MQPKLGPKAAGPAETGEKAEENSDMNKSQDECAVANQGFDGKSDLVQKLAFSSRGLEDESRENRPTAATDDICGDYRMHMQQALRSIRARVGGFVHVDRISLEGLPNVSLKEIGRLALPLCAEQQGENAPCCAYA